MTTTMMIKWKTDKKLEYQDNTHRIGVERQFSLNKML